MKLLYYPGCTVKATATEYEKSALGVLKEFGIDVIELDRWICCGVYHGLTRDTAYQTVAPIRNLIWAQSQAEKLSINNNYLLTLCSMCYNTLKSAHLRYLKDENIVKRIKAYLNDEPEYKGNINVIHFMQVLKELVGYDKVKEKLVNNLKGLKVAPFYGCMLLRPREIAIDDPENPQMMQDLLRILGAEPITYPYVNQCCYGYLVTRRPDLVWKRNADITNSALERGARIFVTTCPLCAYNLLEGQKNAFGDVKLPVFYESELVAYALGKYEYLKDDRLSMLKNILDGVK